MSSKISVLTDAPDKNYNAYNQIWGNAGADEISQPTEWH